MSTDGIILTVSKNTLYMTAYMTSEKVIFCEIYTLFMGNREKHTVFKEILTEKWGQAEYIKT